MLDPRVPEDQEPRGKPRRAGLAVLGIPAVAVVLALVLRWSTPMGGLVTYELEIFASKTPVEPGQALSLVLRPERAFNDPVEARVFVERQPGSSRQDAVPFATEVVPGSIGALRITLDGRQLPARGRIIVLIGRPGSVPAVPAGAAAHGRNWQRFDIDIGQPTPAVPPQ